MTRNQINRIEKQNKINICIFGYDTKRKAVFPIYPTYPSLECYDDRLDLLYIEGKNELGEETTHYVLVAAAFIIIFFLVVFRFNACIPSIRDQRILFTYLAY